jgi:hypothetical protein
LKKVLSITQKELDITEIVKLIPTDYFVLFYSPVEKIDQVTKLLSENYANVIGCSNYKNIYKDKCAYDTISIMGIKVIECRTLLIHNANKSPIRQYKEIQKLKEIYKPGHSMIITFTDGLTLAEENVLTVINNELKDIPLIGGSAGDKGDFNQTKVTINKECISNATAVAMITTDMFIDSICENIYETTDLTGIITECDLFSRKIIKINNKPALSFYTEKLGLSKKDDLTTAFIDHPIGRIIGDKSFIASIMSVDADDSINVYCRIFPNSYVSICNPIDYRSLWKEKANKDKNKYIGGIFVNCIFRTNLFEKDNSMGDFINFLNNYGDFVCMTSYGEQFNNIHANQTLTGCVFRESDEGSYHA